MNLTSEQAIELLDGKKYISYRFQLFDDQNHLYHGIHLDKKQVDYHSHQFVKVAEYDPNTSTKGYNYSYGYNCGYRRYKITAPKGDLFIYLKKGASEISEFQEFINLISEYPSSYEYYLGDLAENNKHIDLIVFIDMSVFIDYYTNNGYLSKNMVKIIQKYALNQYKIYQLKDCSNESEYSLLSPNFKLSLYDYQKQTLNWMSRIENKDYKFLVPQSSFFKLADKAYIELIEKQTGSFLSQYVFESD